MKNSNKLIFILAGFGSLLWFLIRVVPKPSRATYPCQRAAYPIASSFIIWCVSIVSTATIFRKINRLKKDHKFVKVMILRFLALVLLIVGILFNSDKISYASNKSTSDIVQVKRKYDNTIEKLPVNVSVVKSEEALAENITTSEIESLVREAIEMAGGFKEIITNGMTVVLKPNLVNNKELRTAEVNGVTTDYRVIQAVANIVNELNPDGKIILLEGSANGSTLTNMAELKYFEIAGIDEFIGLEESSGDYRDYSSEKLSGINLPDSLSLYPDELKPNNSRTIYYNKTYYEADVIISIPVLKNHQSAGITGGVKNVAMGCTPTNIYASSEHDNPQLRSPVIKHAIEKLDRWLHDYYAGKPVDFVIMDGLQGVSSGPNGAVLSENQQNMRLIMASRDAIAIDAIAGLIMGHDPQIANYLVYLHNNNFGIVDPALIQVDGMQVPDVRKDFGFDFTVKTETKFDKFTCDDYELSSTIVDDTLIMKVLNPGDLARISFSIDGNQINKFVIGGFDNIKLSISGIDVTDGNLDVIFEDRYLNSLEKKFTSTFTSDLISITRDYDILIYPNPVKDFLYINMQAEPGEDFEILITDSKGSVISTTNGHSFGSSFEQKIDVTDQNPGIYFVTVKFQDGRSVNRKFIKAK